MLATKLNHRPLATILGPGGGGIDFEVTLPERSRLLMGVGMAALIGSDDLYEHASDARIDVSISRDGAGFYTLLSVKVLAGEHKGNYWFPLEADLSAFGGERVTLRFAATGDVPFDENLWAFWGSPRIALRPPEGS